MLSFLFKITVNFSFCETPADLTIHSDAATLELRVISPGNTNTSVGFFVQFWIGLFYICACYCTFVFLGKILPNSGSFFCETQDGFNSSLCNNNGTCVDGASFFSCDCTSDSIGARCYYSSFLTLFFLKHLFRFNHVDFFYVVACPVMQEINVNQINHDAPLTIQSPAFFHDYPSNSTCRWILKNNDTNRVVHFDFVSLAVKPNPLGPDCMDVVSIRGPSDAEPM